MTDYRGIFEAAESTIIKVGSASLPPYHIQRYLNDFKRFEGRTFSDAEYYAKLVDVVYYSGFRAATVNSRLEAIHRHFPDYETVAEYGKREIERILADPGMIRNQRKAQACAENAHVLQQIIHQYQSFQNYIDSHAPGDSFENLMLLKEELEYRFDGLGRITTYHFLTDIGLNVLKPDRVICRIFKRLGLIESDEQLLKAVIQGRRFAQETGHPIRYIDIVFVAYGQVRSESVGLKQGICVEENPLCGQCGIRQQCSFFASA